MPNAFCALKIQGDEVFLGPSESQHLKVVRVQPGDKITCINGDGILYSVVMLSIDKNGSTGRIVSREIVQKDNKFVTVAVASTKWPRLRLVIEKATELGGDEIEVFESRRSIARVECGKSERYEAVVREAAKQSVNPFFPIVKVHRGLPDSNPGTLNLLLDFAGKRIFDFKERIDAAGRIRLLVGPEGGFTGEEVEAFRDSGIRVSLGKGVLRVETAVIVSLGLLNSIIERI